MVHFFIHSTQIQLMKKTLFTVLSAGLLLTACSETTDPFLITSTQVGPLTQEIKVKQLDSLFVQDSIVKITAEDNPMANNDLIEVYEKGGVKLLSLSPKTNEDPESKISNIQIFDSRYKTENDLNLNSTFKEVEEKYTISSIANTMRSLVVSLEGTNVYIIIDKEVLPDAIKNKFGAKVEATDIPEDAKIKFLMVGWEKMKFNFII